MLLLRYLGGVDSVLTTIQTVVDNDTVDVLLHLELNRPPVAGVLGAVGAGPSAKGVVLLIANV